MCHCFWKTLGNGWGRGQESCSHKCPMEIGGPQSRSMPLTFCIQTQWTSKSMFFHCTASWPQDCGVLQWERNNVHRSYSRSFWNTMHLTFDSLHSLQAGGPILQLAEMFGTWQIRAQKDYSGLQFQDSLTDKLFLKGFLAEETMLHFTNWNSSQELKKKKTFLFIPFLFSPSFLLLPSLLFSFLPPSFLPFILTSLCSKFSLSICHVLGIYYNILNTVGHFFFMKAFVISHGFPLFLLSIIILYLLFYQNTDFFQQLLNCLKSYKDVLTSAHFPLLKSHISASYE